MAKAAGFESALLRFDSVHPFSRCSLKQNTGHRAGDSGVAPTRLDHALVASTVEQRFCKPSVVGSIPAKGSRCRSTFLSSSMAEQAAVNRPILVRFQGEELMVRWPSWRRHGAATSTRSVRSRHEPWQKRTPENAAVCTRRELHGESGLPVCRVRLLVRSTGSQPVKMGSIPIRGTCRSKIKRDSERLHESGEEEIQRKRTLGHGPVGLKFGRS